MRERFIMAFLLAYFRFNPGWMIEEYRFSERSLIEPTEKVNGRRFRDLFAVVCRHETRAQASDLWLNSFRAFFSAQSLDRGRSLRCRAACADAPRTFDP